MTTQVMTRSGGRRFGPTALAMQSHRSEPTPVARPGDWRRSARPGWKGSVACPAPRQPRGDRTARRRPVGDATRPPMGSAAPRRVGERVSCPPNSAAGGYRMGRWSRLAMTIVVTAAIVVGCLTLALRPGTTPTRLVTVQPGDTLLSVVLRDMPSTDPVAAMQRVARLNSLSGSDITVGTVLRIPAG